MASLNRPSDARSLWKVEREHALQPFRHAGSLECPKLFDQRGRLSIDANGTAMRGRQKSGFDHVVQRNGAKKPAISRSPTGLSISDSWFIVQTSISSSTVPIPPGIAMKASARSAIRSLR